MRAILRNMSKMVETVVSSPPPYSIMRRGDVWTNRDADLHEHNTSGILHFKYSHTVNGASLDCAYYDEVAEKPMNYSAMAKLVIEKLRPQIIARLLEAPGNFSESYAKSQSAAGTKKELLDLVEFDALKVVEEHKKKYGYSTAIEKQMATIGAVCPAEKEETPFDYLTRLLGMANNQNENRFGSLSEKKIQQSYNQSIQYKYKNGYQDEVAKIYQGMQAIQPHQPDWYVQQTITQNIITQTNSLPSGPVFQPAAIGDWSQYKPGPVVAMPREAVKPKRELPDPIEPRRRLMKKK